MRMAWCAVAVLIGGVLLGPATTAEEVAADVVGDYSLTIDLEGSQNLTEPMLLLHASTDAYDTPEARAVFDQMFTTLRTIGDPAADEDAITLTAAQEAILNESDVKKWSDLIDPAELQYVCSWKDSASGSIPPSPILIPRNNQSPAVGFAYAYFVSGLDSGEPVWIAQYLGATVNGGGC